MHNKKTLFIVVFNLIMCKYVFIQYGGGVLSCKNLCPIPLFSNNKICSIQIQYGRSKEYELKKNRHPLIFLK